MARFVSNPPNPWLSEQLEWLEPQALGRVEVLEEDARTIVARNDSPDVPFTFSVNPYRGCQHACAYCYARPTHQHLGLGAGTDFDRKIVVKRNAPELLRAELGRAELHGEPITFSGVTDCYQPLETRYELTRRCLEACLERGNPVAVITKSVLVARDAPLLAEIGARSDACVFLSIPFADPALARALEPGAPTPADRFETLRQLSAAGIRTALSISPVVPGLGEHDLPRLLARARACGASAAFMTLLRLPGEVREVFEERLRATLPGRAAHVLSALRDARGGRLREGRFGARMRGSGARWETLERLFELHCRRLGLDTRTELRSTARRVEPAERIQQLELWSGSSAVRPEGAG